jgi:uncharacterized membrane protein YeaQ/YmgE (transglycosylase-associated protein family)
MNAKAIIIWLIVGAGAGWLAGMVVKGGGYGLIGNIVVGIVGGLIASTIFSSALTSRLGPAQYTERGPWRDSQPRAALVRVQYRQCVLSAPKLPICVNQ